MFQFHFRLLATTRHYWVRTKYLCCFVFCESQSPDVQIRTTHNTTLPQTVACRQGGTVSDHHQRSRSPVDDLTAVRDVMVTHGRCAAPHLLKTVLAAPGTLMCWWHGITSDGYLQLIRFLKWTFCGKCVCFKFNNVVEGRLYHVLGTNVNLELAK